ncbi:MAG TPA: DUF378 domain-containing protein [Candidatus Sulfotelmatobacter sp.]|nr:DUF378 domain-containing protein [Candidatus Sulfotelmatobacter sp.]
MNKYVEWLGMILVIVGALNWGLVGLGGLMGGANWNVVWMLLGSWPTLLNLVYVLVGLSGLWLFWDWYVKMKKK